MRSLASILVLSFAPSVVQAAIPTVSVQGIPTPTCPSGYKGALTQKVSSAAVLNIPTFPGRAVAYRIGTLDGSTFAMSCASNFTSYSGDGYFSWGHIVNNYHSFTCSAKCKNTVHSCTFIVCESYASETDAKTAQILPPPAPVGAIVEASDLIRIGDDPIKSCPSGWKQAALMKVSKSSAVSFPAYIGHHANYLAGTTDGSNVLVSCNNFAFFGGDGWMKWGPYQNPTAMGVCQVSCQNSVYSCPFIVCEQYINQPLLLAVESGQ